MKIKNISFLLIFLIIFSYGVAVGHYQIFPFEYLSKIKASTNSDLSSDIERIQIYQDMDKISDLISIQSYDDVEKIRSSLINYMWLEEGFPSNLVSKHKTNISDPLFSDLENLLRIDSFTVEMDYGMTSTSYLFLADNSNNELIIYHQGHERSSLRGYDSHSFEQDLELIEYFLSKNYSVLIFSMPGKGMNNEPIIDLEQFGTVKLNSHNHFKLIESDQLHPIKFFIEPVIITLNQIEHDFSFNSIKMIGLSGGGWTTVIVSAIDPRINQSYSIAGSFPMWLRSSSQNFGDYEQNLPDFYKIANYEELYILGALGKNRSLYLFYNEFDPCCFSGQLYEKYPFASIIQSKLSILGDGEFKVIIDKGQNKHVISDFTKDFIFSSLK